jgi:hypothetical protein
MRYDGGEEERRKRGRDEDTKRRRGRPKQGAGRGWFFQRQSQQQKEEALGMAGNQWNGRKEQYKTVDETSARGPVGIRRRSESGGLAQGFLFFLMMEYIIFHRLKINCLRKAKKPLNAPSHSAVTVAGLRRRGDPAKPLDLLSIQSQSQSQSRAANRLKNSQFTDRIDSDDSVYNGMYPLGIFT